LNGLPIVIGGSKVWRVEEGGEPTIYCGGFTFVTAIAFAPSGDLYVLEYAVGATVNTGGALIRVAPDCTQTTVVTGLKNPTGLAVDNEGNAYISMINGINFAAEGQVRRFAIP
jgi:sugar lactone lactonase YvrE